MKLERVVTIICGILTLCILCTGLFFWHCYKVAHRTNDLQPMRVLVDGVMYSYGGGIKKTRPEGPPDGYITEIIEPVAYPQKDGQANFGSAGMPYWNEMGTVVIETDQYRIFRP